MSYCYRRLIADQLGESDYESVERIHGDHHRHHCTVEHIARRSRIQNRAYCPWFHVLNTNNNRYPQHLVEARCRCLYGAGLGAQTACEQVNYNLRVLLYLYSGHNEANKNLKVKGQSMATNRLVLAYPKIHIMGNYYELKKEMNS